MAVTLSEHENAERILREGWRLFQQKGFRGVTIDELCLTCGLTKPTLYYYFHDKENLFVQILVRRLQGFREVIEQPGPWEKQLEQIAAAILDSFQTEYSVLMHDMEHIKDPANQQRVSQAFRSELLDPMVKLMERGIREEILATNDPRFLAQAYMSMINGFIARMGGFSDNSSELANRLARFFLEGAKTA